MFHSPNRFAPLAPTPEYSPLAYIDVDFKPVGARDEEWNSTRAMVDCGGQGSFINEKFSRYCHLPSHTKAHPVSLILADGSQSQAGHITHYNPITLRTGGNEETLAVDVAPTAHDIILGMPWLQKHDPADRFSQQTLTFDSHLGQQHCGHYGQTLPLHAMAYVTVREKELGEE
jgi:hypothetical protein